MKGFVLLSAMLISTLAYATTAFVHAQGTGYDLDSAISDAQRHLESQCYGQLSNVQVVNASTFYAVYTVEMTGTCTY